MKVNIYHQLDVTGLYLFLAVKAGLTLEHVTSVLGKWSATQVEMDLHRFIYMDACDDLDDMGFTILGSGFINQLPSEVAL